MLKVHTKDGQTVRIDLEDEQQAKAWIQRVKDPTYQASITGLTVAHRGVQYSIPRPKGMDPVQFLAEYVAPDPDLRIKGGERIVCLAGDVRATIMVHREQRAARVTLFKTGKQRYNPLMTVGGSEP